MWKTKQLTICSTYNALSNLPFPMQELVHTEYVAAQNGLDWLLDFLIKEAEERA